MSKEKQPEYKYNSLWVIPNDITEKNTHPLVFKSLTRFVDLFPGLIGMAAKEEEKLITPKKK